MKNNPGRRLLLLLSSLLLVNACPFRALALNPDRTIYQYNCQTWRRANGLPANSVTAIAQTSDGRLWLGTSKGLVYFDGVGFRVFNMEGEGGMSGKVITGLARRSTGGLWFGLERGSFGYFDKQQFHSLQRPEWGGPFATVRCLQETRNGTLILGGSAVNGKLAGTNLVSLLPTNNADVFSMYEDAHERIWIGTAEHGLFYWDQGQLKVFPDPTLRGMVISAVTVDPAGNIWVGTANGLRRYEANFQPGPVTGFTPQPRAMLVDRHGVLWIGTMGSGLMRYADGKFTSLRKQDGLASDRILSLAESDDGSLWVGTEDGLSQLTDVKFPILSVTEGLVVEVCLSVASSPKGGMWAGTPNGLSYFHDGSVTNFGFNGANGFRSHWIKRIFEASNGDVYCIGARKNLDRLAGGNVVMSWTNNVWPRAVAEDAHGILVAMAADLMRLEDDKLVPARLADGTAVSLRWINDLMVARDSSIWIAAFQGVFQIKDGVLHNWSLTNGLEQSAFSYLCEDDDGSVWAAQNTGIARFKNGGMKVITRQQGLHEDFVYAIVPDKFGNFWMDSNRGIFRVSQSELNAVADGTLARMQCSVYDGEDAVKTTDKSAQDYSGCRSTDGRIWFPSSKGVIMIDPANVPNNPNPPTVSIELVRINGQEYPPDQPPVLEPGAGNLEFGYSALDYRAPLKIQYRYRLEGFETQWVEAGNRRSAFYTNLKPGNYVFQVQACNADGVWNITGTRFAFKLPPRFHETGAFQATVAVAGVGLVAYFWWVWHQRRKHVLVRRTRDLLEVKVQERTSELRKEIEERKRMQLEVEDVHKQLLEISRHAGMAEIATNVLHNVGNVLNSVNISTGLIVENVRKSKASSLARVVTLLQEHPHDLGSFITNDPRGKFVPAHLAQLSENLLADQATVISELDLLRQNVEHINEIVAMQQNYARVGGVKEMINVVTLMEDSLRMNVDSLQQHGVEVVREFENVPSINVEKHKILQILVNLVRNAKMACDESGRPDKRLTARVVNGNGRIRISVLDNGVGIPPENLTRIFNHGFTTRKEGHGFGLHSGALAARELGGSLSVHSDGTGQGAAFTLELPCSPSENSHE